VLSSYSEKYTEQFSERNSWTEIDGGTSNASKSTADDERREWLIGRDKARIETWELQ
jgi:hypothetical protein